jgi:protein-arginine deiminase
MSPAYRDFLKRQEVQAPLIELELDWLLLKHVDEVVYFLSGRQVAMPSPALAEKLLVDFYRDRPDPAKAVFLKGPEIVKGKVTGVHPGTAGLILCTAGTDLRSVKPDMYLHIFKGSGRYQTYRILAADETTVTVSQEEAHMFSFWRNEPIEMPSAGSEFIVVARPLHNRSAQVLLISLSELMDRKERDATGRTRTDNQKIRAFWSRSAAADRHIHTKVLPEIQKLSPSKIYELPVLFDEVADPDFGVGLTAFTPNLVNGHLFENTFVMPKSFVLSPSAGHDLFEDAAAQELHGFAVQFVDDYFMYHNFLGEVHCGPNLIREPPDVRPFWWQRKQTALQ